ncbi:MAG: hypothetical protein GXO40_00020 [Epsilonproteobacteria bacterium]|nr:hypothetical protein [Campylobacterota bacterium]
MAKKILNAEEGKHLIAEYVFKPLNVEEASDEFVTTSLTSPKKETTEDSTPPPAPTHETASQPSGFDTEIIEKVLQRSDTLVDAIAKLEQQLKAQAEFYEKKLEEIKETSYKAGYNEGYAKAKEELEEEVKSQMSKFVESIHKLEDIYKDYQTKAENIEKELASIAIDIAEEVIAKELSKDSKQIALNLAKSLIEDIKEATKIEIKVNPLDYEYVKEHLNLEKIKITPDNVISQGGVVILSDAGNIEAEIYQRFKAIKTHILERN